MSVRLRHGVALVGWLALAAPTGCGADEHPAPATECLECDAIPPTSGATPPGAGGGGASGSSGSNGTNGTNAGDGAAPSDGGLDFGLGVDGSLVPPSSDASAATPVTQEAGTTTPVVPGGPGSPTTPTNPGAPDPNAPIDAGGVPAGAGTIVIVPG